MAALIQRDDAPLRRQGDRKRSESQPFHPMRVKRDYDWAITNRIEV